MHDAESVSEHSSRAPQSSPAQTTGPSSRRPSRRGRRPLDLRRARWAVSLLFWLNGASFCAILPRYPEIFHQLDVSKTAFGLALGIGPVGGLLSGLAAASLMKRFGSARVAVAMQVVASTTHLAVYVSPSWLWLTAALMCATAADALTDIAMNSHGMRVERRWGRSIMSSYHGWWSAGAVVGGLIGSQAAQLHVPLAVQGGACLVVFGALALLSHRWMLPGADTLEREAAGDGERAFTWAALRGTAGRMIVLILALGVLLVAAGSTEDAGNSWGALYMTAAFGASPFLAGMAFTALQGAQMIGRFAGDAMADVLGDRGTARLGAVIAGVGMALGLWIDTPVSAIIGFACAGWGVATLFPAVYRAADDMTGVAHGVGLTVVGWMARIGFFASPPIVGALADALSLSRALWLVPCYALGILLCAGALETRRSGR